MSIALFVPCYVDQLYPHVAIAALHVLEQLGEIVHVPAGAVCCGQPSCSAGFERMGEPALNSFARTFSAYDHTVVVSGSCALHVRTHAPHLGAEGRQVAERTAEFCSFLHDVVGLDRVATLNATLNRRVGIHIGCHGLRGLGLASPSERQIDPFNKVRALLETVRGMRFAAPTRPD